MALKSMKRAWAIILKIISEIFAHFFSLVCIVFNKQNEMSHWANERTHIWPRLGVCSGRFLFFPFFIITDFWMSVIFFSVIFISLFLYNFHLFVVLSLSHKWDYCRKFIRRLLWYSRTNRANSHITSGTYIVGYDIWCVCVCAVRVFKLHECLIWQHKNL